MISMDYVSTDFSRSVKHTPVRLLQSWPHPCGNAISCTPWFSWIRSEDIDWKTLFTLKKPVREAVWTDKDDGQRVTTAPRSPKDPPFQLWGFKMLMVAGSHKRPVMMKHHDGIIRNIGGSPPLKLIPGKIHNSLHSIKLSQSSTGKWNYFMASFASRLVCAFSFSKILSTGQSLDIIWQVMFSPR